MGSKDTSRILFGTAGTPETSPGESTLQGIREVARLGLDTMELEFVQGVRMGPEKASEVGLFSKELNMPLSVHAPYYINLAAKEEKKIEDSAKRILDSARIGSICGADQIVFHAGFFMERPPNQVFRLISKNLKDIREQMNAEGLPHVWLRPELTGKATQYGSPEELYRLCADIPGVLPCMDFSHLYARTQAEYNTYDKFRGELRNMADALGEAALRNMHIHLSGIEFTPKGEKKHLNVEDSGINYLEVLKALWDAGASGRVVCESPDRGHDALLFKNYWTKTLEKKSGKSGS